MTKNIGIISPPVPGHLFNHCAIGKELIKRGYKVAVYSIPDNKELVESLGVNFYVIAEEEFPKGSWQRKWEPAMSSNSFSSDKKILAHHNKIAKVMLETLPEIFKQQKISLIIVDQTLAQGAAIAQKCRIPYVTVCTLLSLHKDRSGVVPPVWTSRLPAKNIFQKKINKLLYWLTDLFLQSFLKETNNWCKKHQLKTYKNLEDSFSNLAQIGVIPPEINFSERKLPKKYVSFGPLLSERKDGSFPFDKLDDRPIIYVSMGTIRTRFGKLWNIILDSLSKFKQYQLVLTTGTWTGDDINLTVPKDLKNPIIVKFAPQLKIITFAKLCITHGGPGTILECLLNKVPMVVIPIGDDQPAMAARVDYHGLGCSLKKKGVNSKKLAKAINNTIDNKRILKNIKRISQNMDKGGGASKATDVVEKVMWDVKEEAKNVIARNDSDEVIP